MNIIKPDPDSTWTHTDNQWIEGNNKEDPLFISFPVIKTENEVRFIYVWILIFACCLSVCVMKHLSRKMDMEETLSLSHCIKFHENYPNHDRWYCVGYLFNFLCL
jgi:hypothetical protein